MQSSSSVVGRLSILLLILLAAVKPSSLSAAESRAFQDDLQRTVFVPERPARIISLAPSITEMLFAVGLDSEIVGVTPFCDYPPAAASRPKVGYSHPSLESIVALNPDVILAPGEFMRADLLGQLEALKIPTLVLTARSVRDVEQHLFLIGRLFQRLPQAERVVSVMRQRMDAALSRLRQDAPVRVLYVLNSHPLITVGPGSYIHELLEQAGAVNIAASAGVPYPRISMDTVLLGDPELLLFPVGKAEGLRPADRQLWARWTDLSAVRQGRLIAVPSDLLNRPGPRIADALVLLIDTLHASVGESSGRMDAR